MLGRLLHKPPTCAVDSLGVAGLIDLLRTQGLWLASVRYGYVFGAVKSMSTAGEAAAAFERPRSVAVVGVRA